MIPLLVCNPTNIRYLTGFSGLSPTEREAYVLFTDMKTYLFTNPLYREEAQICTKNTPTCMFIEISRDHPFSKELSTLCKTQSIQALEFESDYLTVSEYEKLKDALVSTSLIPSHNRIEEKRTSKTSNEIDLIRQACVLTDECFSYVRDIITPGMYESEVAVLIESFFKQKGAGIAFSPIAAFGRNASKPHYAPDGKGAQLQKKDTVLLDFGARVNGYCADMTRMIFITKPNEQLQHAYNSLRSAQEHALTLLAAKERSGSVIDTQTRNILEQDGFPTYPHSLGHALGLDIHESPRIYKDTNTTLTSGMIITIEPGIYIEGTFGMRIEDTVCITDSGIDILTKTTKDMIVL